MEYIKLIAGIVLTATFIWLLVRNSKRTNFVNSLLQIDTILGLMAGVYLIFTSAYSLMV